MLGALLLSGSIESRNRNLFHALLSQVEPDQGQVLMVSTIALDDNGRRSKVGSLCAPLEDTPSELLDPQQGEIGRGQAQFDPYRVPMENNTQFSSGPTPDLVCFGNMETYTLPSRSTCVYSSLSGTAIFKDGQAKSNVMPGSLLVRMSLDDQQGSNFAAKVRRNMLDPLTGRFSSQIVSVGPDPLLILVRRERHIYTYWAACGGNYYLIWSDKEISRLGDNVYLWPLTVFDNKDDSLSLGFSIRMLRGRWLRWMTLKRVDGHIDYMRIPKAISCLREWLIHHSR